MTFPITLPMFMCTLSLLKFTAKSTKVSQAEFGILSAVTGLESELELRSGI